MLGFTERLQQASLVFDELALALLASMILEEAALRCPPDMTLTLFEVILKCPLISRSLLLNCGSAGICLAAASLNIGQTSHACDILKGA
jgi:hypothetical protein